MKNFRRHVPSVNAGSMADIAFLLLIFFLITTTISADKGILRTLPSDCPTHDCNATIAERNILRILINSESKIMIDETSANLIEVKDIVKAFIDNNGNGNCEYCSGTSDNTRSDHPKKAVISLKTDALASYKTFIAVQDEISKAYYDLRANYASTVLQTSIDNVSKEDIALLKDAYPFILSEADTR